MHECAVVTVMYQHMGSFSTLLGERQTFTGALEILNDATEAIKLRTSEKGVCKLTLAAIVSSYITMQAAIFASQFAESDLS
jgi:hypothetical protein